MDKVEEIKNKLDDLLLRYKVQPVGWGYIDCITIKENTSDFVNSLTKLGIGISELTWWCHCAVEGNKSTGCPHGGGGPRSKYFDGYFSEMYQIPIRCFSHNDEVLHFIISEWPANKDYLPCLVPAFWLNVPDDLRNLME